MILLKCYNHKCPDYTRAKPDNCGHPFKQIRECDNAKLSPPRTPAQSISYYHALIRSDTCHCENEKKEGYSFCYSCYKALPRDMQKDLFQTMGDGYEEAYEAAVNYLEREVL